MMKTFCIVIFALLFTIESAYGLRCSGRLIELQADQATVIEHCGEPIVRDAWQETVVTVIYDEDGEQESEERHTEVFEVWTYNFGPSVLIRFLTFHDGRLAGIEIGQYGYRRDRVFTNKVTGCGSRNSIGVRKIDVLKACGSPIEEIISGEERVTRHQEGTRTDETIVTIQIEEWVYPGKLRNETEIITFENGQLTSIESADAER